MKHFSFRSALILFLGICILLILPRALDASRLTNEEQLSVMREQCGDRVSGMLMDEVNLYRAAQYGPSTPLRTGPSNRSVLNTVGANTSDLVPYLVLNYHALSCSLRTVCNQVRETHGHVGTGGILEYRPLGCSRLFAARGRWWSKKRRDEKQFMEPIAECEYVKYETPSFDTTPSYYQIESQCDAWTAQILQEERQMLRLLVAQDAAERGTRRVVPVFQNVLADVRGSFLIPLRGLVDLFGSVIHPIPCYLRQCN